MSPMQSGSKFTDRITKYLTKSAERKTTRASKSKGHVILGHLRSFKGWIQTEACVIPSYRNRETNRDIISVAAVPTKQKLVFINLFNPS